MSKGPARAPKRSRGRKIRAVPPEKRIHYFGRLGSRRTRFSKDRLGGKGASLAYMRSLGLPVPPGFTITTEVCAEYYDRGEKLPPGLMDQIQENLYRKAHNFRDENTHRADTWEEFTDLIENKGGFVFAHWDGTAETENKIKDKTKASIRLIPIEDDKEEGSCILTGKPSKRRVVFAKAY